MPSSALEKLRDRVASHEKKLHEIRRRVLADKVVTEAEFKELAPAIERVAKLRAELDLRVAGTAAFDHPDFIGEFEKSIGRWCMTARIDLNEARHYFERDERPDGLTALDIVKAVSLALQPEVAAVVGVAVTLTETLQKVMNSGLPKQPSLSEIQNEWSKSLQSLARDDKAIRAAYEQFAERYRKAHKIAKGAEAPKAAFERACARVWRDLPGTQAVQKAFLKAVLAKVKDSWDTDDYAGVAEVRMSVWKKTFRSPTGQLDDVNEPLRNAIATVWGKNEKLINLPVPIQLKIGYLRSEFGEEVPQPEQIRFCKLERTDKTPGSYAFRLISNGKSDPWVYEAFIKSKAYNLIKLSHISHDA